ncbi:MAG: ribonuclease R [Phycisphaerae bacterium]|nr:MAG: ribonuclease R [Phycisphaerae bacterium]
MSTEDVAEQILRFITSTDYRPQKVRALARSMGISDNEYGDFHFAVKGLRKTGRLALGSNNVVTLPQPSGTIVGSFRLNPRGFGFVIPENPDAHGDLFVPPGDTGNALTGDTVEAKIVKRGKRGDKMLFEGRVVEVLNRAQNHFVGELLHDFNRWFVRPDGNTFHGPVFVDDPGAKSTHEGDQVVVEITRYPTPGKEARGVIVRVLGERGLPEVDTLSMVVQYQLPEGFPPEVLQAAGDVSRSYNPEGNDGRVDLSKETIITIDPVDARDFDDAISLKALPKGQMELGVHIADVSHFVQPGSILDQEATARTTSVYFPRHVIPMLPEVLSNGVCSLQEREPRFAKSAFITYDKSGNVVGQRFASTLIRSTKRLTYEQASAALDGKPGRLSKKVLALLKEMESLAKTIRRRRVKNGMLVLDLPEVDLVYDEKDNVTGVTPTDTSFSHTIIEMFMIEANEAVGRLFAEIGVPHLRRIHPDPADSTAKSLGKFLGALGLKVPKSLDRFELQSILKSVKGKPESFAVNLALLKSMQTAEYSPKILGHYALAGEHYVHFTSPIRRYPDLTAHRLLDAYIKGTLSTKSDIRSMPSDVELRELGAHCSRNERRAEAAERELRLVKILRILEARVGDSVDGIVTGVTNFGLYVQLREFLVDGLLRFEELADDWWVVDVDHGCVNAERSGRRISIGQELEVTISQVDVAGRQLNLALSEFVGFKRRAGGRVRKGGARKPKRATKGRGPKKPTRKVKKKSKSRKPPKAKRPKKKKSAKRKRR